MKYELKLGRFQIVAVVLFIILSFSLSKMLETEEDDHHEYNPSERLVYVETKNISPGEYRLFCNSTGNVEAKHEVGIIPQVSGRIVWVSEKFYKGEMFDKDEPLFEVDRSNYDLDVIAAEAEVARANTALDIEVAESKLAFEDWKQLNGSVAAPDLVLRKPQLTEAHARLKAAIAQREKARLNLSRTIFRLPFSGQVIESNLSEGQFVAAGQKYGSVYDSNSLELHASLSEAEVKIILDSGNPEIDIEIDSVREKKIYKGHLKRNATEFDRSTRLTKVRFGFNETLDKTLVGSFAKVTISGDLLQNISIIPSESLQKDGAILIVDSKDTISIIKPNIVQVKDDFIAIQGMSAPFKVVVGSMPGAIEGMKITMNAKM
jgi:RND family efflux transporter MFP subunit